jgi:hypothetical protein
MTRKRHTLYTYTTTLVKRFVGSPHGGGARCGIPTCPSFLLLEIKSLEPSEAGYQ